MVKGGESRDLWFHGRHFSLRVAVMLIGQYQHNIDAKNRVIVPAKFREDLGERFMSQKGLDGCLFVLSRKAGKIAKIKL